MITINENVVKYIFNKESILRNILYIFAIIIIVFVAVCGIMIMTYSRAYNTYKFNVDNTHTVGTDIEAYYAKCYSINCRWVIINKKDSDDPFDVYKLKINKKTNVGSLEPVDDDEFQISFINKHLTSNFNLIIYGNDDHMYVIQDNEYIISGLYAGVALSALFILIFVSNNIRMVYVRYKIDAYERNNYKMYTENKLQGNLTEMIHHEISTPLSILTSCVSRIKDNILHQDVLEKEDKEKLITSMDFSINRITNTVGMLANSKHFRHSDNVTIYEIANKIVADINNSHIGKLDIQYDCKTDILDSYYVDRKLDTSHFMNILTVLFNNSLEAGANLVTIKLVKTGKKMMIIDVSDNGRGIRDTTDNLFNDSGKIISEYGYSTKDAKGNQIIDTSIINKLLNKLGVKVIKTDTSRGLGLYMNKMLLKNVRGSIELISTSERGTTFRLMFPVVKK